MRRSTIGRAALAGLVLAGVGTAGCVSRTQYDAQRNVAQHWKRIAEGMQSHQDGLDSENRALRARLAALEIETTGDRSIAQEAATLGDEYRQRLRELEELRGRFATLPSAEPGDIEILRGPEGPVVRIQDRVLFASGSDEVTAGGVELLKKVAVEIASKAKAVRVEGHTDTDPVRVTRDRFPYGNRQLSAMRAIRVADVLIRQGGIADDKVSVVGYGEHRAIAPNDSPENKRRNRRVEIVLIEG